MCSLSSALFKACGLFFRALILPTGAFLFFLAKESGTAIFIVLLNSVYCVIVVVAASLTTMPLVYDGDTSGCNRKYCYETTLSKRGLCSKFLGRGGGFYFSLMPIDALLAIRY